MQRIRSSIALPALALALLATPATLFAQTDAAAPATAASDAPKPEMKAINRSMRSIVGFLKKPEGAAPTEAVVTMQKRALEAKLKIPSLAAKQPEDERDAFVKAYRKQVNVLLRHLLDLEDALEAAEWKQAAEIAGAINDAKKAGHGKFKGRSRK